MGWIIIETAKHINNRFPAANVWNSEEALHFCRKFLNFYSVELLSPLRRRRIELGREVG